MMLKEKIELAEKQIYEQQKNVAYDTREFTIEILVNKYCEGEEKDLNEIYIPEYQREFVWDNERKSKFMESILLGLPIPFIYVSEIKETGRLEIVDGSQRIRTLASFLKNGFAVKKLEILTELNGFKFKDLSIPRQRKLKNTAVRTIVLSDKTSEEVRT